MKRVFFYVQHLLGIGHVFRALRIARGLREAGFAVDLVLGGVPVSGLDLSDFNVIQLLPLKAGPQGFSELVTATGEPADATIKAHRETQLLAAYAECRPDVVLIEAFPFGRRQVRFELMPFLQAIHASSPRPRVFSSIRDILQESRKPERARETVDALQRYFDGVIVHGDPRLARLEETFPLTSEIAQMLHYSGIVAPQMPSPDVSPSHVADVVISAGGGAVGAGLIEAAIAAKPLTSLPSSRWLAVTGPYIEDSTFDRLALLGQAADVTVERFVPDLTSVLTHARLSVSQAGYNTVADVLVAGCKSVFIPFARGGETEQTRRAHLLREQGVGITLAEECLEPSALASAIDQAIALPIAAIKLDADGAAKTATILAKQLASA